MTEPVYGDPRQCPYCHTRVPDHSDGCPITAAQDGDLERTLDGLRDAVAEARVQEGTDT